MARHGFEAICRLVSVHTAKASPNRSQAEARSGILLEARLGGPPNPEHHPQLGCRVVSLCCGHLRGATLDLAQIRGKRLNQRSAPLSKAAAAAVDSIRAVERALGPGFLAVRDHLVGIARGTAAQEAERVLALIREATASRPRPEEELFLHLREQHPWYHLDQDALTLLSDDATADEKRLAAQHIASYLFVRLQNPTAKRALVQEAKLLGYRTRAERVRWVSDLVVQDVLGAAEDRNRPQAIRLGRKWLKDRRGLQRKIAPSRLDDFQAVAWLHQSARRRLEERFDDPAEKRQRERERHQRKREERVTARPMRRAELPCGETPIEELLDARRTIIKALGDVKKSAPLGRETLEILHQLGLDIPPKIVRSIRNKPKSSSGQ
jgi:hypothetical protein